MVGVKMELMDHVILFRAPKWPHSSSAYMIIWFRIPLFFQCFIYFTILMVGGFICALSYEIVRCVLEKTRSASSLIAGIERILSVIRESFGQRFLCGS